MAYVVGTLQTATQATGTSYTVNFPSGVLANDLLLVMLSQDGSTESLAVSASGFTALGTQTESGACSSLWFFKIAAGGETSATFACANDDIIGTAILVRDAHATTPLGASPASGTDYVRSDWNNVNSAASGSLTTAVDECLLIYSWCADGAAQYMRCKLSEAVELDKFNGGQINHIIGCNQQQAAGAAPTVTMYNHTATEGGNGWILAIRNKTGGALQPIPRVTATDVKWYGSWAAQHDSVTWQAPDQFAASINSITCSATGPTVDATNLWTAQGATYGAYTLLTSAEPTAGAWVGGTHTISSTDMTGKVFSVEWARNGLALAVTSGAEGNLVCFSDGTNWVAYQVASRAKGWALNDPDRAFIALGNATAYASSGSINWGAVTRVGFFAHRIGSSSSSSGLAVKNAILFDSADITGGGSSKPATFLDLNTYVNSWSHYRVALLQASSQVLVRTTVQLGDGTNATYFDGAAQSLEFPQAWSASSVANWQMNWNALANQAALSVKAKTGDTIRLASGVAATDTAQNLSINASSAAYADATYSFAQSFVGWREPTDNKGLTWVGATFKECGTVTIAGGGDMTNCTIASTSSANAALAITANGSTLDGCTVDGTGADYALELGTSVTAVTLTDCTITAGSTDKVHVLKTTGTVTITISGTTSLSAGDVTTAGATVVIAAPQLYQSATVSGFTSGARIQIYDATSSTELFNGTASAGDTVVSGTTATWTDPTPASADRAIRVRVSYVNGATAKNFIETSGLTCGQTSGTESVTYPVTPTADTTYNSNTVDGSAVTGITFVDSGSNDRVDCNIAADTVPLKDIYAAFVYWNFTATGIANDFTYIDAPDTANYILSGMKIRNTSADPLKITGGYFYDSTGSVENCVDTAGSTGNIFPMPAHVVPYQTTGTYAITGDISTVLAAIPSASDNATEVWSNNKALTVPKFLGLK